MSRSRTVTVPQPHADRTYHRGPHGHGWHYYLPGAIVMPVWDFELAAALDALEAAEADNRSLRVRHSILRSAADHA